jgi:hypothetical protein
MTEEKDLKYKKDLMEAREDPCQGNGNFRPTATRHKFCQQPNEPESDSSPKPYQSAHYPEFSFVRP